VTYLSKVTSLNWDHCMRKMQDAVSKPKEKSILYEEVPYLPWGTKEWMLFRKFSPNVRAKCLSLLRECKIRFEYYRKWVSLLSEFTYIQPAFYPVGIDNYLVSDFLFETLYQKQLAHILGMLPSTSLFFSVVVYFSLFSVIISEFLVGF